MKYPSLFPGMLLLSALLASCSITTPIEHSKPRLQLTDMSPIDDSQTIDGLIPVTPEMLAMREQIRQFKSMPEDQKMALLGGQLPAVHRNTTGNLSKIDQRTLHQTIPSDVALALHLMKQAGPEEGTGGVFPPLDQRRTNMLVEGWMFGDAPTVKHLQLMKIPTYDGKEINARVYRNHDGPSKGILLLMHGGGWVLGSAYNADASARHLARMTDMTIVNLDYRLAPEYPFPTPAYDAIAAFRFIRDHAKELGSQPNKIVVGGESAGANLSAVIALATKNDPEGGPALQLLINGVYDFVNDYPSMEDFASGFFLTKNQMEEYERLYFKGRPQEDKASLLASPGLATSKELHGMAPAYMIMPGADVLIDQEMAFSKKLKAAGVKVTEKFYEGHIHAFTNGTGFTPRATDALKEAADFMTHFLED